MKVAFKYENPEEHFLNMTYYWNTWGAKSLESIFDIMKYELANHKQIKLCLAFAHSKMNRRLDNENTCQF